MFFDRNATCTDAPTLVEPTDFNSTGESYLTWESGYSWNGSLTEGNMGILDDNQTYVDGRGLFNGA